MSRSRRIRPGSLERGVARSVDDLLQNEVRIEALKEERGTATRRLSPQEIQQHPDLVIA